MSTLLFVSWLCLPLAPINPVEEDTLAGANVHVIAGMTGPNGIMSLGPIVSSKVEILVTHPFVVRVGVDLKYGRTVSSLFPKGDLYTATLAADAIYYRGTDHLTGYVGFGVVYAFNHFNPLRETADSLRAWEDVTTVDVAQQVGYRITLGLRHRVSYSLEIAITELRPDFIKRATDGNGAFSRSYRTGRTGGFRVTFGYLFPITLF